MSAALPGCPQCREAFTYERGALLVCPMCGHEWTTDSASDAIASESNEVKDSVGNVLADGDTVTIAKDLKVKGAGGGVVKVGTRCAASISSRMVWVTTIDATVPGFGRMQLKSSVVKNVL